VSKRDGQFENRIAKFHPILLIIELLYTLFFFRIWQPCSVWSVVCKQRLLKHARRFFTDLFTYTDQVNNKCCLKLQLAKCLYYQLSVASTVSAVSEVAVLHHRYAGVFAIIVSVCYALENGRYGNAQSDTRTPCVGVPVTCNIRQDRWLRERG